MNSVAPASAIHRAHLALAALVPFVLGAGMAIACYAASGASLGLFFGPVLLVSLVAPALTLGEETLRARLIAAAGVTLGIWLVWLFAGTIGLIDALRCGLIVATWIVALTGFATLLRAAGLHAAFASTFTALLALAWLTWPVWLSHWLSGQSVPTWLTAPHPLLSLNGVLLDRFPEAWDRRDLAYRELTVLNQDILYTMPASIWPMVVFHAALGTMAFAAASLKVSRRGHPKT
ncbi:MAG: hypothetical protein JWM97_3263 [Phycisphaerales bacterium]|jgi:hypothetical protein|nr:hypothetical protein [Phycisphaerales bacterium]